MSNPNLIQQATTLAQVIGADQLTPYGQSCLEQGEQMAEILQELNVDDKTIAAALLYGCAQHADLSLDDIAENLGSKVGKLIKRVKQLEGISELYSATTTQTQQYSKIDNIRKMLLAMVNDIRAVLIKLAERLILLKACKNSPAKMQQQLAHEVDAIYAPLANRLGLGSLKWQLEDLCFRYLNPEKYREISKALQQRRVEREEYITKFTTDLAQIVKETGIEEFDISGRPKHIYSIYSKMERKKVGLEQIYDILAVRVLVSSIADCYKVLSIVQSKWEMIASEFDDYIATPKPNGYQSIHTAIVGPNQHNIEIQIRTHKMHKDAELGVAAHWVYKEGPQQDSGYENKIAWLRQVMAWQREVSHKDDEAQNIFTDRVYVFTPNDEVRSLPAGATPLDFAYQIHSEIGSHCKGATINDKIVNLTYQLQTGDKVNIITAKNQHPSRDWLNPQLGFLKTSRARAKVHNWFKKQDYTKNIALGQQQVEKEFKKHGYKNININKIATTLKYKTTEDLYAALGNGEIKITAITNLIQQKPVPAEPATIITETPTVKLPSEIEIYGVDNLLTTLANCCHPIPGDNIVGYITRNRGITIHRHDCPNIIHAQNNNSEKLLEVNWGQQVTHSYPVNIIIEAYDRYGLIKDITNLLNNEKINLIGLSTIVDKKENIALINVTIEIGGLTNLQNIFNKLTQLNNVITAKRC